MLARIVDRPIDPASVLAAVGDDADGASLLFLGTVRNHNEGRPVHGLHYEVYREMAESVLAEIAEEAAAITGSSRIAVFHRTGELDIGDVSVAIAVSTPHRAEAFDAARYMIEEIKSRLPVWKRERYADGDAEWLPGEVAGTHVQSSVSEGAHPGEGSENNG